MATKRGFGEGAIYRRKDRGLWVGSLDLGYQGGRRVRRHFYGRTKKEVQEKLGAAMEANRQGKLPTSGPLTVSQFLASWLEDTAGPRLRPSTKQSYADIIRLHLTPAIGGVRLEKLTPQQVQALLNARLIAGLSPRRVQYLHAVLRAALNQAVRWELVPRNVASLAASPRVTRDPVSVLSPEEAKQLLDAVRGNRLEALYTVALSLGLRQGEVLGLRWQDIDFRTEAISVVFALQRVNGTFQLVEPKTTRSRRVVKMPAVVAEALKQHKSHLARDRRLAGGRWHESDLVFTTTIGTPLDGTNVTRQFQRLLKSAGLPQMRFHDLRHSCASLLLAQGVHPRVVMETLGHSQISVTMNTYTHVSPAVQGEAADAIDRVFGDGGPDRKLA